MNEINSNDNKTIQLLFLFLRSMHPSYYLIVLTSCIIIRWHIHEEQYVHHLLAICRCHYVSDEIVERPTEVCVTSKLYCERRTANEPPRGKTNNVVSEQVRHKPACTSTEKS